MQNCCSGDVLRGTNSHGITFSGSVLTQTLRELPHSSQEALSGHSIPSLVLAHIARSLLFLPHCPTGTFNHKDTDSLSSKGPRCPFFKGALPFVPFCEESLRSLCNPRSPSPLLAGPSQERFTVRLLCHPLVTAARQLPWGPRTELGLHQPVSCHALSELV